MATAAEHDAVSILATWGEEITYAPKDGEARTITAVVDEDGEGDLLDTPRGVELQESISVYVLRDNEDETYGGIDKVNLGDVVIVPTTRNEIDPDNRDDGKRYSWSGVTIRSDRYSWTLRFGRSADYERGGFRR